MKKAEVIGIADAVSDRFNVCLGMAHVSDVVREIEKLLGDDSNKTNIKLVLSELMLEVKKWQKNK